MLFVWSAKLKRERQAISRLELFTDIYGFSDAICYTRAITAERYVQDVQCVAWHCASSVFARLAEKLQWSVAKMLTRACVCVSFPLKYFLNHQWSMWRAVISECFVHAQSTKSQSKFQSHILHHPSLLFHHLGKCIYYNVCFYPAPGWRRSPPGDHGINPEISVCLWWRVVWLVIFSVKSLICK